MLRKDARLMLMKAKGMKLMRKEKRLQEKGVTHSDIDRYCRSVEEPLRIIYDRCGTRESRKKAKDEAVYCLEDILYN